MFSSNAQTKPESIGLMTWIQNGHIFLTKSVLQVNIIHYCLIIFINQPLKTDFITGVSHWLKMLYFSLDAQSGDSLMNLCDENTYANEIWVLTFSRL